MRASSTVFAVQVNATADGTCAFLQFFQQRFGDAFAQIGAIFVVTQMTRVKLVGLTVVLLALLCMLFFMIVLHAHGRLG